MALQKRSKIYTDKDRTVVYIPNSVKNDSQFPFTSTVVNVRIEGDKLIIEEVK